MKKLSPLVEKILELDEEIKRLESQIESETMKELRREGIKYHQSRDER